MGRTHLERPPLRAGAERGPVPVGPGRSGQLGDDLDFDLGGLRPREGTPSAVLQLQRAAGNRATSGLLQDVGRRSPGSGAALPPALRARMEPAFGADLSGVRVHLDPTLARHGANALARGEDIVFAPGRYSPGTPSGDALIGHELAHVLQQRAGLPGHAGGVVGDASLESEARELGRRAAAGLPAPAPARRGGPAIPAIQLDEASPGEVAGPAKPTGFEGLTIPPAAKLSAEASTGDLHEDPAVAAFIDQLLAIAGPKGLTGNLAALQYTLRSTGAHTEAELAGDYASLMKGQQGTVLQQHKYHWLVALKHQFRFLEYAMGKEDKTFNKLYGTLWVPVSKRVSIVDTGYASGKDVPVRPILKRLLDALWERVGSGKGAFSFRAENRSEKGPAERRGDQHNWGSSVDVYLTHGNRDESPNEEGFFPQDHAIAFLRKVRQAADAVGALWNVYYNDADVAQAVGGDNDNLNVKIKARVKHPSGKVNFHGPGTGAGGLKLHFHLDVVPAGALDYDP